MSAEVLARIDDLQNDKNQEKQSDLDGILDVNEQTICDNLLQNQTSGISYQKEIIKYFSTILEDKIFKSFQDSNSYQEEKSQLEQSLIKLVEVEQDLKEKALYETKNKLESLKEKVQNKSYQPKIVTISETFTSLDDKQDLTVKYYQFSDGLAEPEKAYFWTDKIDLESIALFAGVSVGGVSAVTSGLGDLHDATVPATIAALSGYGLNRKFKEPLPQAEIQDNTAFDDFKEEIQDNLEIKEIEPEFLKNLLSPTNKMMYGLFLSPKNESGGKAIRELNNDILNSLDFNKFSANFNKLKNKHKNNYQNLFIEVIDTCSNNTGNKEVFFKKLDKFLNANVSDVQVGEREGENIIPVKNNTNIYQNFYQLLNWMNDLYIYNNMRFATFKKVGSIIDYKYEQDRLSRFTNKVVPTG